MEEVLDSIRRIVNRWTRTSAALTANASPGDTSLSLTNTRRFRRGDRCMIREQSQAEATLTIDEITDNTTIQLSSPIRFAHAVSDNATLVKTINDQYVQAIYIGDPAVIPRYPAITVNGTNKSSEEWLTLESTKEVYNLEITVYVLDSTQEEGYRYMLQLAKAIETGLKKNIFPIMNDYSVSALTNDAAAGDVVLTVADSSVFSEGYAVVLENRFTQNWTTIDEILDSTHLSLKVPICNDFEADGNTILILPHRRLFNSWPSSIDFGYVHKGTLLKSARINWFGWEEQVHNPNVQDDTYLT